jgi:hypothetical protein
VRHLHAGHADGGELTCSRARAAPPTAPGRGRARRRAVPVHRLPRRSSRRCAVASRAG